MSTLSKLAGLVNSEENYKIQHQETKDLLDKFLVSKSGEPLYFNKVEAMQLAKEMDKLLDKLKT